MQAVQVFALLDLSLEGLDNPALFLDELGLDLGDFGHEFLDLEFERSDVPRILLLVLGVGEGEGFYILFEFEVGLVELVALAAELYHLFD